MPSNCCVPICTNRGYRDKNNAKISYYTFPKDNYVRKQWIHAIRREEGKSFRITASTKVCSRHFRDEHLKKTLAGKIILKPGAVPSKFAWSTSPRKRKPPTQRTPNNESTSCNERTKASYSIFPEGWIEKFTVDIENNIATTKRREVGTQTYFMDFITREDAIELKQLKPR